MITQINVDTKSILEDTQKILLNLEKANKETTKLRFITIKELQEALGCSQATAQEYFNMPDFPATDFPKEKKAEINAVIKFFSVPRRKR